jgi:hypothetical protein
MPVEVAVTISVEEWLTSQPSEILGITLVAIAIIKKCLPKDHLSTFFIISKDEKSKLNKVESLQPHLKLLRHFLNLFLAHFVDIGACVVFFHGANV